MSRRKEWFGEWFDSPYYHILYKHRDETEAADFLDKLVDFLQVDPSDYLLDLGCGKGRHARYLNQKGFQVDGIDLSPSNIQFAREFENERLHFFVHDMREIFDSEKYDYVLNMFTSFGYFETQKEDRETIQAAATSLRKGGKLIVDFLNPYKVIHHLVPEEVKQVGDIEFHINRSFEDGFIKKDIKFTDQGRDFHYQEKVRAIRRTEFYEYFELSGLTVLELFGDYNLSDYDKDESDRLIFIVEK